MNNKSNLLATAALAIAFATPAFAADDAAANAAAQPATSVTESTVPEGAIVVTARRRAELLQDIPLAIDAFNEEAIERENLVRIDDLTKLNAGLTFDIGGFPNDTRPAIRGMQAERGRPSVAVLLDGHDLSGENLSIAGGSSSLRMDLFDLERIEIVKGPQATLYGRNAFAGAINYISKRPEFDFGAKFTGEIGSGHLYRVAGSITGPIIEDLLAFRINGAIKDFGGYYTNPVNKGPLGAEKTEGVAGSLLFTPTSNLKILGRYQYSHSDMSDNPTAFIFANTRLPVPGGTYKVPGPQSNPSLPCPASLTGQPGFVVSSCTRGTVVGPISADESDVQMSLNPLTGEPPFGMKMSSDIASAKVEWDTGNFGTFTYTFGYLKDHSEVEQDGDFTSTPAPPGLVLSINALQSLDYRNKHTDHTAYWNYDNDWLHLIAGVQIFEETSRLVNNAQFWLRSPTSPLAGPPFRLRTAPEQNPAYPVLNSRKTDYTGIFGGIGIEPIGGLKLNAEVRYNDDEITYTTTGQRRQDVSLSNLIPACIAGGTLGATVTSPPPPRVVACPDEETIKDSRWTPRFSAQYNWTPDIMTYASYAEGFKPGGFNTNEIVSFDNQGYLAETVKSYEVGLKSSLFDRRVLFNIAGYRNDYSDQQIGVQLTQAGAGGGVVTTAGIVNAGVVRTKGIEMDLTARLIDQLTLGADYAYTDATFKEFIQGPPPGSAASAFTACGVPAGQTSSDQNRAEAGNLCGDFSGNAVGKSPKHSLNLTALLEVPSGETGDMLFVEAIGSYRSKRYVDESNLAWLPSYWVASLKAGANIERYSITLYVENLFDSKKIRSAQRLIDFGNPEGFAPGRGYLAYLPQPRSFGMRVGVEF